jgi:hypothetical protein
MPERYPILRSRTNMLVKAETNLSRARQPVQIVPKGWGREIWIANGDLYCGKILEINKGRKCSLHFHKIKTESFYLRAGRLKVRVMETDDSKVVEEFELKASDSYRLERGD